MSVKKVGYCIYAHRSNIEELLSFVEPSPLREMIRNNLMFTDSKMNDIEIVKYNKETKCISFIQSPDWFSSYEPVVGDSINVNLINGKVGYVKGRKNNKQIYHSKELFMADDYDPIWMKKARDRTETWKAIPGIGSIKNLIGNQNFWFRLLVDNGIEC